MEKRGCSTSALLRRQRLYTDADEAMTGKAIPWVSHRESRPIRDYAHAWRTGRRSAKLSRKVPHDFRRSAVRNPERAGVPRSVAMKLTGHKTEAVYLRYAIVSEVICEKA
jgi:integrase